MNSEIHIVDPYSKIHIIDPCEEGRTVCGRRLSRWRGLRTEHIGEGLVGPGHCRNCQAIGAAKRGYFEGGGISAVDGRIPPRRIQRLNHINAPMCGVPEKHAVAGADCKQCLRLVTMRTERIAPDVNHIVIYVCQAGADRRGVDLPTEPSCERCIRLGLKYFLIRHEDFDKIRWEALGDVSPEALLKLE